MAKLVSNTYGDALFELAKEDNNLDSIMEEVLFVKQSFENNHELIRLLNHPKIVKEEKVEIIENIYKKRLSLSDTIVGFLRIIVTKDRYNDFIDIFDYFVSRVREYKNIGVAYITSAVDLTHAQKESTEKRLLTLTKYEKIEMNYQVDKSLIGGMIIRIGDRVVDSSIKTRLNTIAKDLSKIQLV